MNITRFIVPANSTLWRYAQANVFSRFTTQFGQLTSLFVRKEREKCLYRSCGNTRITTFRVGWDEIGFRIYPKSITPSNFAYRGDLYRQRIADKLRSYNWR